jgi:hypothetical protein
MRRKRAGIARSFSKQSTKVHRLSLSELFFTSTGAKKAKKCNFATMQNLGLYISELLSEHDCVIVPGFGGFVARPAPAHFAKAGNMLLPPGKSLVFNKNLDNSDGLLANHIAQRSSVSYREAAQLLDKWVSQAKQQLDTFKRLELERTGILYYSPENTLLFEPASNSNHQLSSFGLAPVKAIELTPAEEVLVTEDKVYRKIEAKNRGSRTLARISVVVSSALLFCFLILITARQLPIGSALASLNPFASKGGEYKMMNYNIGKIITPAPAIAATEVKKGITIKLSENSAKTFVVVSDSVESDKTKVHKTIHITSGTSSFNAPFQIVVGCFAIEKNAEKLIKQLEAKQITAGISGRNAKGLFVVSVAGFTTESMARTKLDQVKQRFPSAWILVK